MLVMAKEYQGKFTIVKVEVIKETAKQYKLLNTGRSVLNKSDLNKWLAYGEIYCQFEDLKQLLHDRVQIRLERVRDQLETLQTTLDALEYTEATIHELGICPDCNLPENLDALSRDNEREICSTCSNHEAMKSL